MSYLQVLNILYVIVRGRYQFHKQFGRWYLLVGTFRLMDLLAYFQSSKVKEQSRTPSIFPDLQNQFHVFKIQFHLANSRYRNQKVSSFNKLLAPIIFRYLFPKHYLFLILIPNAMFQPLQRQFFTTMISLRVQTPEVDKQYHLANHISS